MLPYIFALFIMGIPVMLVNGCKEELEEDMVMVLWDTGLLTNRDR